MSLTVIKRVRLTLLATTTSGANVKPLSTLLATHQVSVHKKHREVHQNPCGYHEDHSVKAQDVEQPQVVDPGVTQHL